LRDSHRRKKEGSSGRKEGKTGTQSISTTIPLSPFRGHTGLKERGVAPKKRAGVSKKLSLWYLSLVHLDLRGMKGEAEGRKREEIKGGQRPSLSANSVAEGQDPCKGGEKSMLAEGKEKKTGGKGKLFRPDTDHLKLILVKAKFYQLWWGGKKRIPRKEGGGWEKREIHLHP